MGKPIEEKKIADFIGNIYFIEADEIRRIPGGYPEVVKSKLDDLISRAEKDLEIKMQARGYFLVETIRKYEKSLRYHIKIRAGVNMSYQEICYLTADCNPDGTPKL